MVENYINDVQTYYNQVGSKYSRFRKYFWSEARKFIDWTKTQFNNSSENKIKFLDLGCGNGLYFQITKEYESYGLDFSEKLIQISAKRYPYVNLKIGNALNTQYSDNFFDIILTVGLFQHLTDEEQIKLIYEIVRVLNLQGIAFISGMIDISRISEINGLVTYSNTLKLDLVKQIIQELCSHNIIEILEIKNIEHSIIFIIKKIKN
jgi:ubiquinone/menaquinone biosynthesis C-methylase UbiE